MSEKLRITDKEWVYGSYPRKDYKRDTIYLLFQYKDFTALCNPSTKRFNIVDGLVERMVLDKLVMPETRREYYHHVYHFMETVQQFDDAPVEKIYGEVHRIRRTVLGVSALEKEKALRMRRGCCVEGHLGIDQGKKAQELIASSETVIFALCQPELSIWMKENLKQAREQGKQVCMLVASREGCGLPTRNMMLQWIAETETAGQESNEEAAAQKNNEETAAQKAAGAAEVQFLTMDEPHAVLDFSCIAMNEQIKQQIDAGKVCLLVYGEEGLLQCKHLLVDSVVYAVPACYYAKAVTNQLECGLPCVVYVPKHFDITAYVPLVEKTRISYWQLAKLWEAYGDEIYGLSLRELYLRYPQYFLNMYGSGERCLEASPEYPIQISQFSGAEVWQEKAEQWIGSYYERREEAIRSYLNRDGRITYISTYFNKRMEETRIPWGNSKQQSGILVHGLRMGNVKKSQVIFCLRNEGLHQMVKREDDKAVRFFSNFLFFMTPKLALLYNELRENRKREQYVFDRNHLDFMLYHRDGKRIETFPLFRKACIAQKRDGKFLFFNYRLGGGRMTLGEREIAWTAKDVDVHEDASADAFIRLYTPYFSREDEQQDVYSYQKLVGAGRLNLVVMQDKIICVRKGEVMLSSVGVVVSLEQAAGEELVRKLGLNLLEDGYYDCENLEFALRLDPPEQVEAGEWEQVVWAYGGGMSLILDGKGICDEGNVEGWLREEGWMSPLSRQTQESQVHKLAKHPRTAIGVTRSGELVILVFSGRTRLSAGADYDEMCRISRQLFPDIWCMMNVDGGGSAMLGIAVGESFMELSYPATSLDSCAGMVRPINTVLCLE